MFRGKFICGLRKEKGYTQKALADLIGVSKTTVLDWENGHYCPAGENLLKLAKIFDVSVSVLLDEDTRGGVRGIKGLGNTDKVNFDKIASYRRTVAKLHEAEFLKKSIEIPSDEALDENVIWKAISGFLDKKAMLDERLSEMINISEGRCDIDAILALPFLDMSKLDVNSTRTYARLCRDGRFEDVKTAEPWIRKDPKHYFELVELLPQQVWGKFPASEDFFTVLDWIANLPPERKEKMLELTTPDEAKKIYDEF